MKNLLSACVHSVVCEYVNNNNEYLYHRIMLCMVDIVVNTISFYGKGNIPDDAIEVASSFWRNFTPNEGNSSCEIDEQYKKLSFYMVNNKLNNKDECSVRAVRLLQVKYNTLAPDYNCDIFPLFIDYVLGYGGAPNTILAIVKNHFNDII